MQVSGKTSRAVDLLPGGGKDNSPFSSQIDNISITCSSLTRQCRGSVAIRGATDGCTVFPSSVLPTSLVVTLHHQPDKLANSRQKNAAPTVNNTGHVTLVEHVIRWASIEIVYVYSHKPH